MPHASPLARRIATLLAVPAVLSVAACGGDSGSGVPNAIATPAQVSSVRFVNGSPDLGTNVDVAYAPTGAAVPAGPFSASTTNLAYGAVTPFVQLPIGAGTVFVRAAGTSTVDLQCTLPSMVLEQTYTVVVAGTVATHHTCLIFQETTYTGTPMYRVHDASLNAPSSIAFGTVPSGTASGTQVPYNGAQVANAGGDVTSTTPTFTPVRLAGPIGSPTNPTFAIGPNTGGPMFSVTDTLAASSLFAAGGTTQPDTSGTLNYTGTAGTSLFAIDCTAAAVASLPGVQCNAGGGTGTYALIGAFDTL